MIEICRFCFRFFTQSKPLRKTTFFNMIGDQKSDRPCPSLPPQTNDEEDQMSCKSLSQPFGLDAVLQRAEIKAATESKLGNRSPYSCFKPKFSMFKSDFQKAETCSHVHTQFKPVKVKQSKLDVFEVKSPKLTKLSPKTDVSGEEHWRGEKSEGHSPICSQETCEEEQHVENNGQSREAALPSLSDCEVYSMDNDSLSLPQLTSSPGSQSVKGDASVRCLSVATATPPNTPAIPRKLAGAELTRTNPILSMFRKVQEKDSTETVCEPAAENQGSGQTGHQTNDKSEGREAAVSNDRFSADLVMEVNSLI